MKPKQPPTLDTARTTGIVLIVTMLVGFGWANSSWQEIYQSVHHLPVHIRFGPFGLDRPLVWWINEGLMVLFFLLVGLAIKREVLSGHLSSWRAVAVPAVAAIAGMLVPAAIYLALAGSDPSLRAGWAIPTATDIVLVLGLLAFLGDRVPASLKIFLTALAIFDDIGAVLVIGLFYGHGFALGPLLFALATMVVAVVATRFLRFSWSALVILSIVLWAAILQAGIEGAITGVLIGLLVPFEQTRPNRKRSLVRLETALKPWVFWVVVPVFALFNTGINISTLGMAALFEPAAQGIILALVLGKPLGILGGVWVLDHMGLTIRTPAMGWRHIIGASLLAGVGFTMSVFIASIAFSEHDLVTTSKLAILIASFVAALLGLSVLGLGPTADKPQPPSTPS